MHNTFVDVQPDGTVSVHETFLVNSDGQVLDGGLYRAIPLTRGRGAFGQRHIKVQLVSLEKNRTKITARAIQEDGLLKIYFVEPGFAAGDDDSFDLEYTLDRQIDFYTDTGHPFVKALWGEMEAPFGHVQWDLSLPELPIDERLMKTGALQINAGEQCLFGFGARGRVSSNPDHGSERFMINSGFSDLGIRPDQLAGASTSEMNIVFTNNKMVRPSIIQNINYLFRDAPIIMIFFFLIFILFIYLIIIEFLYPVTVRAVEPV